MNYRLGLIGHPIKHSLSPWIHQQFFQKAGIAGTYMTYEINPSDTFANRITELKNMHLNGFNVTVPYKKKIIPFLDVLDQTAKEIGAVNTVVSENGKWTGYNTDGVGYLRALESRFPEVSLSKHKNILLIGAGGAARGIYHALCKHGFHRVDIANRTLQNADEVANLQRKRTYTSILTLEDAQQELHKYDIIIQTTSVGMKPHERNCIISMESVQPSSIVSDIIYQPLKTSLLTEAEKKGASLHYGHLMLLYQAQYAFERWTNMRVPIDNMDGQLQSLLEGR